MQDANEFRIFKIAEIQQELLKERDTRTLLTTKYRKTIKIVHSIHAALLFTTSTLTILGALLTVPSAVPIVGTASGLGGLCLIASQLSRKLSLRLEKHENIRILAESKLGSVSDLIAKAFDDNTISMDEYSLILGEFDKFKTNKEQIRKTAATTVQRKRTDLIQAFSKLFQKKL